MVKFTNKGEEIISISPKKISKHFSKVPVDGKDYQLDEWCNDESKTTNEDIATYIRGVVVERPFVRLTWQQTDHVWTIMKSMGIVSSSHEKNRRLRNYYENYFKREAFKNVKEMIEALSNAKSELGKEMLSNLIRPVIHAKGEHIDYLNQHMHLCNPSIRRLQLKYLLRTGHGR